MRSVKHLRKLSTTVLTGFVLFLFIFSVSLSAQEGDAGHGEELFKSNCAACHKLDRKLIGPALKGITEKREKDWLIKWIKNSQSLIDSGDKLAIEVFEEYNRMPMAPYLHLSDQDIIDILAYTDGKPAAPAAAATAPPAPPAAGAGARRPDGEPCGAGGACASVSHPSHRLRFPRPAPRYPLRPPLLLVLQCQSRSPSAGLL